MKLRSGFEYGYLNLCCTVYPEQSEGHSFAVANAIEHGSVFTIVQSFSSFGC